RSLARPSEKKGGPPAAPPLRLDRRLLRLERLRRNHADLDAVHLGREAARLDVRADDGGRVDDDRRAGRIGLVESDTHADDGGTSEQVGLIALLDRRRELDVGGKRAELAEGSRLRGRREAIVADEREGVAAGRVGVDDRLDWIRDRLGAVAGE